MGYQVLGSEATIALASSNTSTGYAGHLVNTGMAITGMEWAINAPEYEKTAMGDTSRSFATQRGEWSVSLRGLFPKGTRKLGNESIITIGSGAATVTMAREWSIDFDWGEVEYTNWTNNASGDEIYWRGFRPRNMVKVSGQWAGIRDSAAIESALFKQGDTAPSATFKLTEEGATDNTIAFSLITISNPLTIPWQADDAQGYTYTFDAGGAITVAGAANLLPSGALAAQYWADSSGAPTETLTVLTRGGGPSLAGKCWLKSLGIRSPIAGPIEVTATLRGTGALTRT